MDIQAWVIGQSAIEIIIIGIMLWFLKSHNAMRKKNADMSALFERPEQILSEMRELTRLLEKNLEEKKEISRTMLGQLEDILKRADHTYNKLQSLIKEYSSSPVNAHPAAQDSKRMYTSVSDLLKQGLSKEEIAGKLSISVSEIDLLIKLNKSQRIDTAKNK
jgi:DNA-binding NarL/FixJ family response regulator